MYILDTNVISAVRRPDRAPQVAAWLSDNPSFAADLHAWLDRTVLIFADRLLSFGPEDARIWGRLSHQIGHDGADLMIAATALHHGAAVVTGNVADFKATGVVLENPF